MNKFIPILLWSLPVCLCLHVIEEFIFPGGFIHWYHKYRPKFSGVKPSYYYKVNAVYIAASFFLAKTTTGKDGYRAFLIVWGFLSCNALITHVRGAIVTKHYSPGMITGIFLYLPLTIVSYSIILATNTLDIYSVLVCAAISALLEVLFAKKPGSGSKTNIKI